MRQRWFQLHLMALVRLILERFLQLWCSYFKKIVENAHQLFESSKKMPCIDRIRILLSFCKTVRDGLLATYKISTWQKKTPVTIKGVLINQERYNRTKPKPKTKPKTKQNEKKKEKGKPRPNQNRKPSRWKQNTRKFRRGYALVVNCKND